MCICKGSSSSSSTLKSKTTKRIVNKSMPPPASPPKRSAPKRPATTANRGMRPPPPPPATNHNTTTNDDDEEDSSSDSHGTQKTALSFDQLSSILDPFFDDTCNFLKQSTWGQSKQEAAPAPTANVAATASHANTCHERAETAYLSPWGEATGDALDCAQQQKVDLGGGSNNGSGGGGALQDFLSSGNSAWMETVQDMEAEKNDMLRLDVRVAFC